MDIPCTILGASFRDRRVAASNERRRPPRALQLIRAIVLHQTAGPSFLPLRTHLPESQSQSTPRGPYPAVSTDSDVASVHQVDRIAAHFVIIQDGTVFYTHDVESLSGSAGGRHGIDIEFAGSFSSGRQSPRPPRLSRHAIQSGRGLIRCLTSSIPSICYIHPHGQIQTQTHTHTQ